MTADVELLPSSVAAFVEALKGERGSLDAWLEVNNEREVAAHVEAYAHATAAKDAEAEALRAEMEMLRKGIVPRDDDMIVPASLLDEINATGAAYKAEVERLAEALRKLSADLRTLAGGETPDGDGVPVNVILWAEKRLAALRIAIDQARSTPTEAADREP